MEFSVEMLSALAGAAISVIANFIPRYENQPPALKQLWMVAAMALVTAVVALTSCLNWFNVISCSAVGLSQAVSIFLAAAGGAIATHMGTKEITKAAKSRFTR